MDSATSRAKLPPYGSHVEVHHPRWRRRGLVRPSRSRCECEMKTKWVLPLPECVGPSVAPTRMFPPDAPRLPQGGGSASGALLRSPALTPSHHASSRVRRCSKSRQGGIHPPRWLDPMWGGERSLTPLPPGLGCLIWSSQPRLSISAPFRVRPCAS